MRTLRQTLYIGAAGAALLGGAYTPKAMAQDSPNKFTLSPGVVVDKEAKRIFVMTADDAPHVAALEANSGKIIWKNQFAIRPVDVTKDHQVLSIGKGEGPMVAALLLDGHTGEVQMRAPLPFPEGVTLSTIAAGTANLQVAAMTTDGESLLRWQYRPTAPLQALPPGTLKGLPTTSDAAPVPAAAAGGDASSGMFRINLKTGEAEQVKVQADANFSPAALKPQAKPLLPEVQGPKYLSADGRHVMARKRTKEGTHRFELMVYDRNGKLLAKFPSNVAWAPFYVEGSQVVLQTDETASAEGERQLEQTRQLKGIDLQSGEVVWRQPIAEVESRIPPPP